MRGLGESGLPVEFVAGSYPHAFELNFPVGVMNEGRELAYGGTGDEVKRAYFVDDFEGKFLEYVGVALCFVEDVVDLIARGGGSEGCTRFFHEYIILANE